MRRLVLAALGLLVLMGSPAAAQILPSSTTTTTESPTTSSTTSTLVEITTTSIATSTTTTARPTATTGRSTTSTTKKKATTSTTELRSTNTFVPPEGRQGTGTTAPALPFLDTRRPGDRYLGLFVVLSAGGVALAALIVGAQVVATRPAKNGKGAGTRPTPSSRRVRDDL